MELYLKCFNALWGYGRATICLRMSYVWLQKSVEVEYLSKIIGNISPK